jgi:hypothetical protein
MKNRHRFSRKVGKPAKKDRIVFWRSDCYITLEKIREELNKKNKGKQK